jgi:hypothetical protein
LTVHHPPPPPAPAFPAGARDLLDGVPASLRAKGEFRFANEKGAEGDDEPVELPNPLPRRAIN